MQIHLRADKANGKHVWITIFANGANCGQLCMREDAAAFFHNALIFSTWAKKDEVIASGKWFDDGDGFTKKQITDKHYEKTD